MQLINHALEKIETSARQVALVVDRLKLSKTRWRGIASDGADFAFDLHHPLKHGDIFFRTAEAVYAIEQGPEPVFEIELTGTPAEAAKLAWALGNLHQPIHVEKDLIRVINDSAVRALLQNMHVPFREAQAIFQPSGHAAHMHAHHHHHGHE